MRALLRGGFAHPLVPDVFEPARLARGLVAPREELALEPSERAEQHGVLERQGLRAGCVVPILGVVRVRRRLRLRHERGGLRLEPVDGHDAERVRARGGILESQRGPHPRLEPGAERDAPRVFAPAVRVSSLGGEERGGGGAVFLLLERAGEGFVRVHRRGVQCDGTANPDNRRPPNATFDLLDVVEASRSLSRHSRGRRSRVRAGADGVDAPNPVAVTWAIEPS